MRHRQVTDAWETPIVKERWSGVCLFTHGIVDVVDNNNVRVNVEEASSGQVPGAAKIGG